MLRLDAGVDLRHADISAGRDFVKVGQVPPRRTGLQRVERVVLNEKDADQFIDCADSTRGSSDNFSTICSIEAWREVAMTKQSTPRTGMAQSSTIWSWYCAASPSATPTPGLASQSRVVTAGIIHVGPKVRRGQAQHHQHLLLRRAGVDPRVALAIQWRAGREVKAKQYRGRRRQTGQCAPCTASGSTSTVARSARRARSACSCRRAGTSRT